MAKLPLLKIQVRNGMAEYIAPEKIQRVYQGPGLVHVPGQDIPSPTGPLVTQLQFGGLVVPVEATVDDIVKAASLQESCVKLTMPNQIQVWVRAEAVERVFASSADMPNSMTTLFFGINSVQGVREDLQTVVGLLNSKRTGAAPLQALQVSAVIKQSKPASRSKKRAAAAKSK